MTISEGYNGFARKVKDRPEWLNNRAIKLKATIHAEENAILFARRDLEGCRVFTWPFAPCGPCAAKIIQVGIIDVVTVPFTNDELYERWKVDFDIAIQQFQDAEVRLRFINLED